MRLERATYALAGIAGVCVGLVLVVVAYIWVTQEQADRRRQALR